MTQWKNILLWSLQTSVQCGIADPTDCANQYNVKRLKHFLIVRKRFERYRNFYDWSRSFDANFVSNKIAFLYRSAVDCNLPLKPLTIASDERHRVLYADIGQMTLAMKQAIKLQFSGK